MFFSPASDKRIPVKTASQVKNKALVGSLLEVSLHFDKSLENKNALSMTSVAGPPECMCSIPGECEATGENVLDVVSGSLSTFSFVRRHTEFHVPPVSRLLMWQARVNVLIFVRTPTTAPSTLTWAS